MNISTNVEKYHAFIGCQLNPETKRRFTGTKDRPSVTISRQIGSGAMAVAGELAEYLQSRAPAPCKWMVFDKNLAEKVLEEHGLPKEIARFMPEDHVSAIHDAVEEMLGLHPPSRTLLQQTTETILHLANLGNVILVGRAANVITRQLKNVFHVRLIAPLEHRIQQVMTRNHLEYKAALDFINKQDRGRKRYLKNYFHTDIDDILQYDLVVNTARIPHREAAHLIGEAVLHWAGTL